MIYYKLVFGNGNEVEVRLSSFIGFQHKVIRKRTFMDFQPLLVVGGNRWIDWIKSIPGLGSRSFVMKKNIAGQLHPSWRGFKEGRFRTITFNNLRKLYCWFLEIL